MKMLGFFFVTVFFACTAPCQEVQIIGFDQSGLLTWSNSPPPLYCGVEANWNLRHTRLVPRKLSVGRRGVRRVRREGPPRGPR